ncbi:MAG: phosphatase PAP2 family protein [Phycisphaeraceae bacterium]
MNTPPQPPAASETPGWRERIAELARPAALPSPPPPWLMFEIVGILLVPLMIISFVAWDRDVTTWVRTLAASQTAWAQFLSHAAHGKVLIPAMVILIALGLWRNWGRVWRWTAVWTLGYLAESVLVNLLKVVCGRHRPNGLLEGHYGFDFFEIGYQVNSFPSGHSAAVGSLLGVALLLRPRLAPVWIIAALAWGSARVFSHSHYISDVLAGLYVGTGCTFLVYTLARRKPWWNRQFAGGGGV